MTATTAPTEQKPAPETQVVKKSAKKTFQELVDSDQFKQQIALALPKHLTPERFIRVLATATTKNPLLLECTQVSMFKCIFDCAAAGLELDGRRAHLVPFRNKGTLEATLILDYRGIAELAMRSGVISNIHSDVVCENDLFEVDRGELKKHIIDYRTERGAMYAVYCIIRMKDGGEKVEVMSKREVDGIRRRSKSADNGPWVTDFNEMAKKTVFKRASKWVPLSAEIKNVVESDDDHNDDPVNITPKPGLSALIGAPDESLPAEAPPAGKDPESEAKKPATPPPEAAGKKFTPEERAAILKQVEDLMIDSQVTESKILVWAHAQKLAVEGQDAVSSLSTETLIALLPVVPTLKAK